MTTKISINGFGRIGRNVLRVALSRPGIEIAAVNSSAPAATLAHLLKYDSVHGTLAAEVTTRDNDIVVDGRVIKVIDRKSVV